METAAIYIFYLKRMRKPLKNVFRKYTMNAFKLIEMIITVSPIVKTADLMTVHIE